MEDLKPCQPGNFLRDGQLANRRRSIQQNEFHDASSYRMPLAPDNLLSDKDVAISNIAGYSA
jgi:hypothetical protein